MKRVLVAKSDFGGHTRGSTITDPDEIDAILAGENAHHVVAATHDGDEPAAAPVPAFTDADADAHAHAEHADTDHAGHGED